jgi:hypothetical protein
MLGLNPQPCLPNPTPPPAPFSLSLHTRDLAEKHTTLSHCTRLSTSRNSKLPSTNPLATPFASQSVARQSPTYASTWDSPPSTFRQQSPSSDYIAGSTTWPPHPSLFASFDSALPTPPPPPLSRQPCSQHTQNTARSTSVSPLPCTLA